MDIMKPELMWIDGKCYRKNRTKDQDDFSHPSGGDIPDNYDEDFGQETCDLDVEEFEHEVEQLPNNRFRCRLRVASAFFPMIIGKKGATKKRLESDTKTRINIPRQGAEGDIFVQGETKNSVIAACRRIDVIVVSSRSKQGFTHFISIPMNTLAMQDAVMEFKQDVLRECDGTRGVDVCVFQEPALLHLTVGVMALMDASERQQAIDLLQDCKESLVLPILNDQPLDVEISGLEIMNDDPAEVNVVYAKAHTMDGSDKLQRLADGLVDKFVASGLMARQYDRVKLHVTLMNTKFRNEDEYDEDGVRPKRETLDSRPVLEKFENRKFAKVTVNSIHLSQRRAGSRRTMDGYYMCSSKVQIGSCG